MFNCIKIFETIQKIENKFSELNINSKRVKETLREVQKKGRDHSQVVILI